MNIEQVAIELGTSLELLRTTPEVTNTNTITNTILSNITNLPQILINNLTSNNLTSNNLTSNNLTSNIIDYSNKQSDLKKQGIIISCIIIGIIIIYILYFYSNKFYWLFKWVIFIILSFILIFIVWFGITMDISFNIQFPFYTISLIIILCCLYQFSNLDLSNQHKWLIIIGIIIFTGYIIVTKYKFLPIILRSGISYFSKLIPTIISLILYMYFLQLFYNYGGLITIFAKHTGKWYNNTLKYDDRENKNKNTSANPKKLNEIVKKIYNYKNDVMIILAPLSILIGLYILYRGYIIENATMDKYYDYFKQIILFSCGIIFLSYIWKLQPKESDFHKNIEYYFSGNIFISILAIAFCTIIYLILTMFKGLFNHLPLIENYSPILLYVYIIVYVLFCIILYVAYYINYGTPYQEYNKNKNKITEPFDNNNKSNINTSLSNSEDDIKFCEDGTTRIIYYNTYGDVSTKIRKDTNCNRLKIEYNVPQLDENTYNVPFSMKASFIIITIIWLLFIGIEIYKLYFNGIKIDDINKSTDLWKKTGIIILGLTISGIIIYILVTIKNNLLVSKQNEGIIPFLVNLITILVVLGILYKILKIDTNPKIHQTYTLILDIIFYIPCLFITLYDNLPKTEISSSSPTNIKDFTQLNYIMMLIGIIILYIIYFYLLNFSRLYSQDGNVLFTERIDLNKITVVSNYVKLNKNKIEVETNQQSIKEEEEKKYHLYNKSRDISSNTKFNYNYGMSFWIYLDSINTTQIDKYLTILNYGNKPTVEYNPSKNILRFSVTKNGEKNEKENASINNIYELPNVLLQKWNNIIINYIGGTVDIFYNGELLSSAPNVSPFMSYDELNVGQENGINGGICNLIYFINPLTSKQIYYLYNLLKNTNPPIMYNTYNTINNIANNK